MVKRRKSKVFVVSSTESGTIRDVLINSLNSMAEVEITPWNRRDLWKPGHFIADELLQFPYSYDFAIAIFGPDDKSISRGQEEYQPRDNVIFETGMFMSYLGRNRTFVILPKDPPVKVLTDLSGLITCRYEKLTDVGGWTAALKTTCDEIAKGINDLGPSAGRIAVGPQGFFQGHQSVIDLLKTNPKGIKPRVVKNIALDMEMTWPLVKDHLILKTLFSNVKWYSLMMDSESTEIKNVASKAVSVDIAANQERGILECAEDLTRSRDERKVVFECKVYNEPPIFMDF